MHTKDVEKVKKPLILVIGFLFHNDSILWGLVKPPLPYNYFQLA